MARKVRIPREPETRSYRESGQTFGEERPPPARSWAERLGSWVRRRLGAGGRTELPPAVDPVPVVRSIIESCDGVDLPTVELLAEDEGVERAAVRTTLDRLRAIGAVRSERGPDGEEVFAWSHLGAPA